MPSDNFTREWRFLFFDVGDDAVDSKNPGFDGWPSSSAGAGGGVFVQNWGGITTINLIRLGLLYFTGIVK